MGKASRWFRSLLGLKKPDSSTSTFATASTQKPTKDKRRWSFVKSYRESTSSSKTTDSGGGHHTTVVEEAVQSSGHVDGVYPDKHAITVAAATAAVAEAAVAAAQAAAAVVRLTSSGRGPPGCIGNREEWAAIKIQAAFRGCLARRALRALKGLVKLQALVRGDIDRKRTAEWLHRLQALIRAQARVRAGRAQAQILHNSFSNAKSSNANFYGPATPEKLESPLRSNGMKFDQSLSLKRNGSKSHVHIYGNQEKCWNRSDIRSDEQSWNQQRSSMRKSSVDDERSVRILEIDSGRHFTQKRRNLFNSTNPLVCDSYSQSLSSTRDSKTHQSGQSTSSCEVQSYSPLKLDEVVESPFRIAHDSPQHFSSSSRDCGPKISPFTPTRSDDSRSYLSGYSDNPSYMAYTESSKAKVRSLSAPKQRPQYERSCSSNMHLVQGSGELRLNAQRSFASKAYPGSGRLDKFGMPVGYRC